MANCEYGQCDAPATVRVRYMKSEYADCVDPDDDVEIVMDVCECCAENGAPSTARREAL